MTDSVLILIIGLLAFVAGFGTAWFVARRGSTAGGDVTQQELASLRQSFERLDGEVESRAISARTPVQAAPPTESALQESLDLIHHLSQPDISNQPLDATLQTVLYILQNRVPFSAGEITLWNEDSNLLLQRGWWGDTRYWLEMTERGGYYRVGQGIAGTVAQVGRPIEVDLDSDDYGHLLVGTPFTAAISVPLVSDKQLRGTLTLFQQKQQRFAPDTLHLLMNLRPTIIQLVRAATDHDRQLHRLKDVTRLRQTIKTQPTLPELYSSIGHSVAQVMACSIAGIFILDPQTNTLVLQQPTHGLSDFMAGKFNIRIDRSPMMKAIWNDREYWVSNQLSAEPLVKELDLRSSVEAAGLRQAALFPLNLQGRTLGVLAVANKIKGSGFDSNDIDVLQILSLQAAIAVEDVKLREQEHKLNSEHTLMLDMLRVLVTSDESNLQNIAQRLARLMHSQIAAIWLVREYFSDIDGEDTDDVLYPISSFNSAKLDLEVSPMFNLWAATDETTAPTLRSDHPHREPIYAQAGLGSFIESANIDQILLAPIVLGGRHIGAIMLANRATPYTESDERIVRVLASLAGVAVLNQRLYQNLQNERDLLDVLYHITSALSQMVDTGQVLYTSLQLVHQTLPYSDGAVFLRDETTNKLYCRANLYEPPSPVADVSQTHTGQTFAEWALAQTTPNDPVFIVNNLSAMNFWQGPDYRSALAVRLDDVGIPLGVLVAFHHQEGFFLPSHRRLFEPLATQLAASLRNASLYELIQSQAENQGQLLRENQDESQKQTAIIQSIYDGVILTDADGNIALFNAAAERLFGMPVAEVMGQPVRILRQSYGDTLAEWLNELQAMTQTVSASREKTTEPWYERMMLGSYTLSAYMIPVYKGQRMLGILSVLRDMTREAEAERRQSEFIERVSHEFRTPLTPIKGYANLLLMGAGGSQLNEKQTSMMTVIKDNTERLGHLVEDIIEIAKLERFDSLVELSHFELRPLIEKAAQRMAQRTYNQNKEVQVGIHIDPRTSQIVADEAMLDRILSNLLENAFNYIESRGRIDVRATYESDDDSVLLTVEDTGIGIPQQIQEQVWQRFERYEPHAIALNLTGTGLGLPIVRHLVSLHHGSTWLKSVEGKGTRVYVRLPANLDDEMVASPVQLTENLSSPTSSLRPTTGE